MGLERGSLLIGMGIVIAVLSGALALTGWLYNGALKEKARIEGEYEAFKTGVKEIGEKAELKRIAELERQRRTHDESIKSLEKRVVAARARADQLCKSAGLSAGCGALPALPSTTRPVDDSAHNQRLVELLRHAQAVTDQLIELQLWVAAQQPAQ